MQTTTTADGIEVEYERRGDGRPLVLLHGGMAPREYWDPVVPQFEAFAPVVPQRPGFGTCLDDPAETGPDEVLAREVDYVRALVEAVDGDPILFGHSYGGLCALEAATDAAVERVVAYEPAVLVGDFRETADLADRMATRLDAGDRRGAMKLYVEQVVLAGETDDVDAFLDQWPVWPDCVDLVEEVLRMNRAVERYELPETLAVDAPALLLTGTEGPWFLRDSVRAVAEALPDGRLVDLDGVSHSGPAEAPGRTAAAIREFLQDE